MNLRFYFDESVSDELARGAAVAQLDVLTTRQDGRSGKPDADVLARAQDLGRVLVTCDVDFLVIADEVLRAGQQLSPIVFFAQNTLGPGELIEDLRLIAAAATDEDFLFCVMRLPLP